eukprot:6581731-Prymnesium_polylepis.1
MVARVGIGAARSPRSAYGAAAVALAVRARESKHTDGMEDVGARQRDTRMLARGLGVEFLKTDRTRGSAGRVVR